MNINDTWIHIKDSLPIIPNDEDFVHVLIRGYASYPTAYYGNDGKFMMDGHELHPDYWQPLPK